MVIDIMDNYNWFLNIDLVSCNLANLKGILFVVF